MLLIHNFNQLLDALNNCSLGLFDYADVVKSAHVPFEDVQEFLPSEIHGVSNHVVETTPDYQVEVIGLGEGQETDLMSETGEEWLFVVDGAVQLESSDLKAQQGVRLKSRSEVNHLSNAASGRTVALHLKVK